MNELQFEEYVKTYSELLYRCAISYCGNQADAEDLVQETFLKLLKKNPAFKTNDQAKYWLLRVLINKAKDLYRSYWSRNRLELTDEQTVPPQPEESILDYVAKLPTNYRVVIQLHYQEGYSIKEIAQITKTKSSTVGNRLARARKLLEEIYKEGLL